MHPTVVQQMRRSLWHTATRWQSQPPRILAQSFATQSPSAASYPVSSVREDDEPAEQQQQTRKTQNSNKYFNLMSVQQPPVTSDAGNSTGKRLKKKKKNWYQDQMVGRYGSSVFSYAAD
ncbi:hypothetical protein P3T76_016053 [Phytophthora citrophthora]|uniref:Uncharacterized protein n=1 Tax=Phytophthora citrophthora TaxID=4793 RepID=A0AAD9FY73_9STRA|nr:hypothetical protein P3T76_016053 [Phytophthora citrophthora]